MILKSIFEIKYIIPDCTTVVNYAVAPVRLLNWFAIKLVAHVFCIYVIVLILSHLFDR